MGKAEKLRRAIEGLADKPQARRYPAGLQSEVERYIAERQRDGVTRTSAAAEVGLSAALVNQWRQRARRSVSAFRRVRVVDADRSAAAPTMSPSVVVHAGTLRIEGLDVAAVAELLRRLT